MVERDSIPPGDLGLAVALIALAGAVDAIGFLKLGGLFVSFMSGNSTQAAVGWILHDPQQLTLALTLVALFVAGAFAGGVVAWAAGAVRRSALLWLLAALLGGAVLAGRSQVLGFAVGLLAFAMGLQNTVLHRAGAVAVGPTYVTGTLVKLGDGLARAATGQARWAAWAPYLLLWLGLVAGGATGALAYARYGFTGLAGPTLFALALAISQTGRRLPAENAP